MGRTFVISFRTGQKSGTAVDVWALACIFLELYTGETPFDVESLSDKSGLDLRTLSDEEKAEMIEAMHAALFEPTTPERIHTNA